MPATVATGCESGYTGNSEWPSNETQRYMDAWVGDRPHWLDAGRCSSLRQSATAKVGCGGCFPG